MASFFSDNAKNEMLDGGTFNQVRLHSGNPGVNGTSNQVGDPEAAVFAAASGGERYLDDAVHFTGLTSKQEVTWFSVWDSAGPTFKGAGEITSGDTNANAAGEFTLTEDNVLRIIDEE